MDDHENSEQIIEARLPSPGDRIDEHTVMAEEVELDLSNMPKAMHFGFGGPPIGEILDVRHERKQTIWQRLISWLCPRWAKQKGHIVMRAKMDLDKLRKIYDGEIEFHPSFIVRKQRIEGDKRIIEAADLTHISMGFRYTPEAKLSLWKRFRAWLRKIVAKAKA